MDREPVTIQGITSTLWMFPVHEPNPIILNLAAMSHAGEYKAKRYMGAQYAYILLQPTPPAGVSEMSVVRQVHLPYTLQIYSREQPFINKRDSDDGW
jgi:hypothetical protein